MCKRIVALLIFCSMVLVAASTENVLCVSNDTHIGWPSSSSSSDEAMCDYEASGKAEENAFKCLYENIMSFDKPNAGTLGFPTQTLEALYHNDHLSSLKEEHASAKVRRTQSTTGKQNLAQLNLPDGLSDHIVNHTISLSLQAKQQPHLYPYTAIIPRDVYYEYVINYANVNEARTNIKPLLHDLLHPLISSFVAEHNGNVTMNDIVIFINQHLWTILGKYHPKHTKNPTSFQIQPIYFKSGQTPLIYDPMSIISYGYASCTGLAILFIDALRTFGIPSRLVGTPAWNGLVEKGNHNWVEIWDDELKEWKFMEPSAGTEKVTVVDTKTPVSSLNDVNVDHMNKSPCSRWFCKPSRMENTRVYAARLDKVQASIYYPMAWDDTNYNVQGEDRTEYYTIVCSQCAA